MTHVDAKELFVFPLIQTLFFVGRSFGFEQ
jgi:hypothetical protein